jgi:hypothetical protein
MSNQPTTYVEAKAAADEARRKLLAEAMAPANNLTQAQSQAAGPLTKETDVKVEKAEKADTDKVLDHPMIDYLRDLFLPGDPVCIWRINKQTGQQEWTTLPVESLNAEAANELSELQTTKNQDVYLCMNPLIPGSTRRLKTNIATIRNAYIEIDYNGDNQLAEVRKAAAAGEVPKPHYVLKSSPGKYQIVWKVENLTHGEQEALNRALVARFKADDAATDCSRILRLPGFVNLKYPERPVVEISERNDAPRHHLTDFKLTIKPVEADSTVGDAGTIPIDKLDHELRRIGRKLREKGFERELLADSLIEIVNERADEVPDDSDGLCDKIASDAAKLPIVDSIFDAEKKIPRGQHDTALYKLASGLRHIGMEVETTAEALEIVCQNRCENYGSDWQDMCHRKAGSAHKYKPGKEEPALLIGGVEVGTTAPDDKPVYEPSLITDPVKLDELKKKTLAEDAAKEAAKQAEIKATWRQSFSAVGELEDKPIKMLIDNLLPAEGVIFYGALTGEAKTLFMLSTAKALVTGKPLVGNPDWTVPQITPVLYMIPETSDRAFRKRCLAFRIPNDPKLFLCRTISKGMPLKLDDPILLEAVRTMKPVVVLDTLVRFNETSDEKDASANQKIANDLSRLLVEGAAGILILHHATKAMRKEGVTLENVLRGTGDFSASAATVYGLKRDDVLYANGAGPLEIDIVNLKPRDIEPPPLPFRLAASRRVDSNTVIGQAPGVVSNINEFGDFRLVETKDQITRLENQLRLAVQVNPAVTEEELKTLTGATAYKIKSAMKKLGWQKKRGLGQEWTRIGEAKTAIEVDKEIEF